MDLTDLARIVSTIIFITVDNTFYNRSVINTGVDLNDFVDGAFLEDKPVEVSWKRRRICSAENSK